MVDSQGALDITSDVRLLSAVNAGSNSRPTNGDLAGAIWHRLALTLSDTEKSGSVARGGADVSEPNSPGAGPRGSS
jgi:hypothetical protein